MIGKLRIMIRDIIARILVVYVILLFVLTLLPVYIILRIISLFVSPIKNSRYAYYTYKIWMGVFLPLVGCHVRILGKEKLNTDELYIFILNHNSLMDIPVSTPWLPGANKTLAKSDFLKTPLFGFIYALCSITINRKDMRSRANSLNLMQEALAQGFHLALYPEGTRNKSTTPLLPFQDGAFKLAVQTQIPIVITVIRGTKQILHPTKKFHFTPHPITLEFIEVVPIKGKTENDIKTLKAYCFEVMGKHV